MNHGPCVIRVEPIIKNQKRAKRLAKNELFTTTLVSTEIAFKIIHVSGPRPNIAHLEQITLEDKRNSYIASTGRALTVSNIDPTRENISGSIRLNIPYSGISFLKMRVRTEPTFIIETKQISLEGIEGRGYRHEEQKDECYAPICAIDLLSIRMTSLTNIIIILTILLVLLALPTLIAIMN